MITARILPDGRKLCELCGMTLGGETFRNPRGTCAACGVPLNPEYDLQRANIISAVQTYQITAECAAKLLRELG